MTLQKSSPLMVNQVISTAVMFQLNTKVYQRFAARKALVTEMETLGLLEEVKDHDLTVPYGDRGGVVIEPMLTDQWYVRTAPLAEPAVKAVENGQIQFVPKQV